MGGHCHHFLTIIDKWLSEDYDVDCARSGIDALDRFFAGSILIPQ